MADVFSRSKRSRIMSRIRGKGNERTELRMLALLRAQKVSGWRRHLPLPGTPDFAFLESKVVLFVDGCFWHGCPDCYQPPKVNRAFWLAKVDRNQRRDRRVDRELRGDGWKVLRIRQCALRVPERVMRRVLKALHA